MVTHRCLNVHHLWYLLRNVLGASTWDDPYAAAQATLASPAAASYMSPTGAMGSPVAASYMSPTGAMGSPVPASYMSPTGAMGSPVAASYMSPSAASTALTMYSPAAASAAVGEWVPEYDDYYNVVYRNSATGEVQYYNPAEQYVFVHPPPGVERCS